MITGAWVAAAGAPPGACWVTVITGAAAVPSPAICPPLLRLVACARSLISSLLLPAKPGAGGAASGLLLLRRTGALKTLMERAPLLEGLVLPQRR